GRRITWQLTGMQRHPAPSQPFHMRHRRVFELAGIMVLILFQNGEHAERRVIAFLPCRTCRHTDQNAVAIDKGALLRHRDDDGDRTLRRPLGMPGKSTRLEVLEIVRRRFWRLGALAALLPPGL